MPDAQPADDGILQVFRDHPLVGLGDSHGLAQEEDFFAALVRDARFTREVQDIVVEFGSASSQRLLDRYLAGENLTAQELRSIWSDRVGWVPGGVSLGYVNFFAQVRAVNLTLPADRRVRVWLGDPPIDWARIRTKDDWLPIVHQRDIYTAQLIEREILSKGHKALIIYGWEHFYSHPEEGPLPNLGPLLQQKHPGAFFIVTPYTGFNEKACSAAFEQQARTWQVPAFLSPIRGTVLANDLRAPGCHAAPLGRPAWDDDQFSGVSGDALLYLGPASGLSLSPVLPDIYLDEAYRAEMSRRHEIIIGKPLSADTVDRNPAAPKPLWP